MKKSEPIKKSEYVLALIVVLYGIWLYCRIISAVGISAPYPNEYREAANIAMTRSILAGENVYSADAAAGVVPPVCYLYGPLMSVLAAGVSRLAPSVPLQVIHYGISIFSMIASCILMALMVRRHTKSIVMSAMAFVMMTFCHWRYGYGYGAPDSLGLCLMTAALFLMLKAAEKEHEGKGGPDFYVEGAALFTLSTFFTKQYFLMIAAVGAVYLFIISKKLFFRYASSGVVFSVITFSLLISKCPLYLTYALYFLKGPGPGAAMGKTGVAHRNLQVSYLGGMLLALFIAVFIYLVRIVISQVRAYRRDKKIIKYEKNPFVLLFMVQGGISALVLLYIGNNDGAFLSYYLQLFTPALVALSVYALDVFRKSLPEKKVSGWIFIAICVIFFGYTVYKTEPRLVVETLTPEEINEWNRAYGDLDRYSQGEIYYSTLLAFYGYAHDAYVYDDGQQFVFTQKFLDSYEKSSPAKKLFPHAGEIIAAHLSYRDIMRDKMRSGKYSLIMRLADKDEVFDVSELQEKYDILDTYTLRAGSWAWDVEYWILKQED